MSRIPDMALAASKRLVRLSRSRRPVARVRTASASAVGKLAEHLDFERLPPSVAVHLAYQIVLGRKPDPGGFRQYERAVAGGELSRREMVDALRGSSEFERRSFSAKMMGNSIHASRCRFVRALPKAATIVDLGGTDLGNPEGAFVGLGYPYRFDSLTIVDLPSEERHPIYSSSEIEAPIDTPRGPVRYSYHSMTDLSAFPDGSVDLVYSGQSIEHVTPEEGALVLKEVARILKPGGYLALDTPNSRVTRLQQEEFVDPDHKVEYSWAELQRQIAGAGLAVDWAKGINYAGLSLAQDRFMTEEVAANVGLFDEVEDCYILACVCRKP